MKLKHLVLLSMVAVALGGCDVGNAPAGQTADEARADFQKKSPEEQIKLINGSPASAAEKAQKIAEIRRKNNLPDPGTPAAAPPGGGSFPGDPRGGK